jgi:hypothetical protein
LRTVESKSQEQNDSIESGRLHKSGGFPAKRGSVNSKRERAKAVTAKAPETGFLSPPRGYGQSEKNSAALRHSEKNPRIRKVNEHLKNRWGETVRAQARDGRQEREKSLDGEYNTAERFKEREKEKYVHVVAQNDRILSAPTFQKPCTNNKPWRNKQTEQAECNDNQASV